MRLPSFWSLCLFYAKLTKVSSFSFLFFDWMELDRSLTVQFALFSNNWNVHCIYIFWCKLHGVRYAMSWMKQLQRKGGLRDIWTTASQQESSFALNTCSRMESSSPDWSALHFNNSTTMGFSRSVKKSLQAAGLGLPEIEKCSVQEIIACFSSALGLISREVHCLLMCCVLCVW